jgi:hypothetical protein
MLWYRVYTFIALLLKGKSIYDDRNCHIYVNIGLDFFKIYLRIGGNIIIMHEVYLFCIDVLVEDGQLMQSFLIIFI